MEFEQMAKLSNGFATSTNAKMRKGTKLQLSSAFPELNIDWLIKGVGEMLNKQGNTINSSGAHSVNTINGNSFVLSQDEQKENKKIPLYDLGGTQFSRLVDMGDWFNGATSVIRNNDESMTEYPKGAYLVIKKIEDLNLLVWGRNYCIETTGFYTTKRLQGENDNCILAYSTNTETNADGSAVFAPIKIPKSSIKQISIVLGYIKL